MSKISIIGSGRVGAGIAYNIAQNEIVDEVILIDLNPKKAEAEALDISHSLCQKNAIVRSGTYSDIGGSEVIVITSGAARRVGESRNDLLAKNANIMKSVVLNILPYYSGSVVVVVSNPVDVMAFWACKLLGVDKNKVIGTGTLLDTVRFQYELSKAFSVPCKTVDCVVIGEHGGDSIPVWSSIKIDSNKGHIPQHIKKDTICKNMRFSADKIIAGKGHTMFGIAFKAYELVRNIVTNSGKVLPISIDLNGTFGINDVFLSLPCTITNSGAGSISVPEISEEEISLFKMAAKRSSDSIKDILDI